MDADGLSVVDNRVGVTFGVELYVPWDVPEAVVDVSSARIWNHGCPESYAMLSGLRRQILASILV